MGITFGFIGTGNMGGALAKGAAKALPPDDIYLHNRTPEKAQSLAQTIGCHTCSIEQAAGCDYVFLGVKPQMMEQLFSDLAPILQKKTGRTILVSMAAGITMERIQAMAGEEYPVIRIMPNTPVEVGSGVVLYDATQTVTEAELEEFCTAMQHCGLLDRLPEALIDAGTSVAGCGPAFAFLFLEALAQGGVQCGLPEDKAMLYAKHMLLGAAQLAVTSHKSASRLREEVCSPGGSTIEGVRYMQEHELPQTVAQGVVSSWKRNVEMSKI